MWGKEISPKGGIFWSGTGLAESLVKIFNPRGWDFLIPHGLTHDGLFFSYNFFEKHEFEVFSLKNVNQF